MKISIRQEHIEAGSPWHAEACPIALAIYEQVPCEHVRVNRDTVCIWGRTQSGQGRLSLHRLPLEAAEFTMRFDCGGLDAVEPFEFDLEVEP